MKTIFCPLCKTAIQLVYKNETLSDWRVCRKCGRPSYVTVDEMANVEATSLHEMIKATSSKREMIALLEYLLKKRRARLDDLVFVIGKNVGKGLEEYAANHMLDHEGDIFSIKPRLQRAVATEISNYVEKSEWLDDMIKG
jgi:hypothetical protein